MKTWLPEATTSAPEVDYLILALLLSSAAILALVFGLMRRKDLHPKERGRRTPPG